MISEIFLVISIFALCAFLAYEDLRSAFIFLLLVSPLLHKEVFSLVRWDLLPIRVVMLAILSVSVVKFVSWLIKKRNMQDVKSYFRDPFLIALLFLWLSRLISFVNTRNMQASILIFGFFTTVVFLYFLLNYLAIRYGEKFIFSNIKFYSFVAFATAFIALVQFFIEKYTGFAFGAIWRIPGKLSRVGSVFWDVNHYAGFLASMIPVVFGLFLVAKTRVAKGFYGFSTLFMIGILFLTNSRSAWIGFGVMSFFVLSSLFILKFGAKSLIPVFITVALLSGGLFKLYSTEGSFVRERINGYLQYRGDSFASHIFLLQGAFEVFSRYPVIGGGYGSFYEHFKDAPIAPTYYSRDPAALSGRVPAHSIWGELLAETGTLGTFAFVLLALTFFATLYYAYSLETTKRGKALMLCLTAPMLGYLVSGIFYSYNGEFFWIVLFLSFMYAKTRLGKNFSVEDVVRFSMSKHLLFVFVISIVSGLLIFVNLGHNGLIPWDEAIYAKISKNIVKSGDFLTLRWDAEKPWYEKPPLYFWISAMFMKGFGISELTVKITSALAGFATILLTYAIGSLYFSKLKGFLAAMMLAGTVQFIYYSRVGMLDVTLSLFIIGALLSYLAVLNSRSKVIYWVVLGMFSGLAVMTKGASGLVVVPCVLLSELILRQKPNLKGYAAYFFAFLLIALPWHVYQYVTFGKSFIDNYIGYHVIKRATESIEGKGEPFYWYFTVLKVGMRIWFIPLIASILLYVVSLVSRKLKLSYSSDASLGYDNNYISTLLWFALIFAYFSSSVSKLVWYIMPLYPIGALLASDFIVRVTYFVTSRFNFHYARTLRIIVVSIIATSGLLYLSYYREMAYASDFTGPTARLIKLKDSQVGVSETLYYDRIEKPLPLFYTDGPIEAVDYNPLVRVISDAEFSESVVYITKNSRYQKLSVMFPNTEMLGQSEDFTLARVKSDQEILDSKISILKKDIEWASQESVKGNPDAIARVPFLPEMNKKLKCFLEEKETKLLGKDPAFICE